MKNDDRYAELAVGYALHALDPEDDMEFIAHLPGCARCVCALVEHRDTLVLLAYAASSAAPPAALLDVIRAGVSTTGTFGRPAGSVSALARRFCTVKLTRP